MNQSVQIVNDDDGCPKSSLFLYRYNNPSLLNSRSIARTVLTYFGSRALMIPYDSINNTDASKSDEPYDCVKAPTTGFHAFTIISSRISCSRGFHLCALCRSEERRVGEECWRRGSRVRP